jgi:phenylacetic acid degradation operon negative regulatory protein
MTSSYGSPQPLSARALVMTVLGEHAYDEVEGIWTTALIYVLGGLGVSEQNARQALSRCAAAGWVDREQRGRDTRWKLTPGGRSFVADSIARVYSLTGPQEPWDGHWLVLLVTVPRERRQARKRLYSALGWAGFGNPAPGIWLTPHTERAGEARQVIDDLGLADWALSFVGKSGTIGLSDRDIVRRAWSLEDVAARYRVLLDWYEEQQPAGGDEMLFKQIELTGTLGRLPFVDPQLPEQLLPGWLGREAMARLTQARTAWFGPAHERWQEIIAEMAPRSKIR